MDTLGQRLQMLRGRKGWTQERLAKESGINRNSLACYETDRNRPSSKALRKLAFSLEVKPADLDPELAPVFTPPEPPADCICRNLRAIDRLAMEKLKKLSEADANKVVGFIIELESR